MPARSPRVLLALLASSPALALAAALVAACVDQNVHDCGAETCNADTTVCINPAPACPICVLRDDGGACPAGAAPAAGDPVCIHAPEGCVQRPLAPVPYCADTVPVGCMPACSVATCGFNVQCLPPTCP